MAFQRRWNWKDGDWTDSLNRYILGILPWGLYCGFDADLSISGMNLNLIHTVTGVSEVDENLTPFTGIGICRTQQGVVFKENTPIVLPVSVGDVTNPRIDLVVLQHAYVQTVGGAAGIYMIIQGTPAVNPVAPALPLPNQQIILGQLYVPANTADLSVGPVVYTKSVVPTLANDPSIMRTFADQVSTGHKKMVFTSTLYGTVALDFFTHIATMSGNFNAYSLANLTTKYEGLSQINGITSQVGHRFELLTKQALVIDNTGNLILESDVNLMHVEAGETLVFTNVSGVFGYPAGTYTVSKAGVANINKANKFFAQQSLNKGGGAGVPIVGGYAQTGFDSKGNYYNFLIGNAANLSWMIDTNFGPNRFTPPVIEQAGTVLLIQVNTATAGNTWTLKNNLGGTPAGFKPIYTPTGADMAMNDGDFIIIVEDVTMWRVVTVMGANSSFPAVYAAIATAVANAEAAESVLNGLITAETAARTSADNLIIGGSLVLGVGGNTNVALFNEIAAEVTRAEAAEAAEVARAEAAEGAIGAGWAQLALSAGNQAAVITMDGSNDVVGSLSGTMSWVVIGKTMIINMSFNLGIVNTTTPEWLDILIPAGATYAAGPAFNMFYSTAFNVNNVGCISKSSAGSNKLRISDPTNAAFHNNATFEWQGQITLQIN